MVKARERVMIEVAPESELARALEAVDNKAIVLVSNGQHFAVSRAEDDLWAGYDPEQVRAALREAAGTLTPEEAEQLKALVYEGREQGTRPIHRP